VPAVVVTRGSLGLLLGRLLVVIITVVLLLLLTKKYIF
jgi:hypothetical protein